MNECNLRMKKESPQTWCAVHCTNSNGPFYKTLNTEVYCHSATYFSNIICVYWMLYLKTLFSSLINFIERVPYAAIRKCFCLYLCHLCHSRGLLGSGSGKQPHPVGRSLQPWGSWVLPDSIEDGIGSVRVEQPPHEGQPSGDSAPETIRRPGAKLKRRCPIFTGRVLI